MPSRLPVVPRSLVALVSAFWLSAACSSPSPGGASDMGAAGGPSSGGTSGANGDGSAATGDAGRTDGPEDTGPPAVRFIGRFDTRDAAGPTCAFPGCRVIARFEGTRVSVTMNEKLDDWMDGGPSEWDVAVDGAWLPKLVMTPGEHDYEIASSLPAGPHVVELYKRSEAQNGTTQFLRYDLGPGGKLLPPPPRAAHRIEIIGDSTPAAFGVEGQGPACGLNKAARFQNFRRSFGAHLGELMNADLHGTVYSGKGITRNVWRPDLETMPVLYKRSNPIDPASEFDLATFVPDVVVVSLGGLDFAAGQPTDDGPAPIADFKTTYAGLLATLRGAYPNAQLFAMISPSVRDYDDRPIRTSLTAGVTGAVDARKAAGDTKVDLVVPQLATDAELTGCEGHGNPAFHERLAQELAVVVRAKTGWK